MIELLFTMRFVWSRIVVTSVALPSSIPLGAPFPFYFVPVEIFLLGYFLDFWSFLFFSPSEELLSTPLKSRLNPPWMRSWFFLIESLMIYFFSLMLCLHYFLTIKQILMNLVIFQLIMHFSLLNFLAKN